jgi:hypothetical protein
MPQLVDWSAVYGWPVIPVALPQTVGGYAILLGYSIYESTGSASATLLIYSGTDTKGTLAIPITLGASQSTEDWFGPQGLHMPAGIFPTVTAGTVKGSLFVASMLGRYEEHG